MTLQAATERPKPAVGYVRCSTDMQEESPEQQRIEITAFAEQHGYAIIEWFPDIGKSGTTFEQRPEFQRLRRIVESNPNFSTVICYDESRWGRAIDAEENTYWRVHFRRHGVEVLLVKTSVDPGNEFAPMLKAFEGVQASQYSKKLSELTLRGAKNNGIYSNGGTAPYGYRRVAVNLKTAVERELPDGEYAIRRQEKVIWRIGLPAEVAIVRYIFEQRAKASGYIVIVEALNRKNIPCPRRGRWKNRDQKWGIVTVKTILENPVYYGARAYNRASMSSIQAQLKGRDPKKDIKYPNWRNRKEDWIIAQDAHESIVTKELWLKANSIGGRQSAQRSNQYIYRSPYLLTGLISCSACGFAFQGWSGKAKGISYLRYIDGGWKNKRVCTFLAIPKERLEQFAVSAVQDTLADPLTVKRIEHHLQLLLDREPEQRQSGIEALERAIDENKLKQRNLIEVLELRKGGSNLQTILERLEDLERQNREIEARLAALRAEKIADSHCIDSAQEVANFILNFEEEFEKADPLQKKALLKKCISHIVVDRDRNVVRLAVRRIPAVTPELDQLLQKETAATKVVTAVSSGGRT